MEELGLGFNTPDLTSILMAFVPIFIGSIVITLLFFTFVIINMVRTYRVQKATLEMQKDVRAIRDMLLNTQQATPSYDATLIAAQPSAQSSTQPSAPPAPPAAQA